MASADVTSKIHSTLTTYQLPGASGACFAKVFKGPAQALTPTSKPVARWMYKRSLTPPEGQRVLSGETMREDIFRIESHWPLTAQEGATESQEDDIYALACDLPEQFLDNGSRTAYGDTVATVTYDQESKSFDVADFESTGAQLRSFTFEIRVRILGED